MLRTTALFLALSISVAHAADAHTYLNRASSFKGPIAYADAAMKTVFYVESDGRHVSAITFEGTVLWTRDPFVDAKLQPYRFAEPKIVSIGPWREGSPGWTPDAKATFIAIRFNSTQFGMMNAKTGEFIIRGQD